MEELRKLPECTVINGKFPFFRKQKIVEIQKS